MKYLAFILPTIFYQFVLAMCKTQGKYKEQRCHLALIASAWIHEKISDFNSKAHLHEDHNLLSEPIYLAILVITKVT